MVENEPTALRILARHVRPHRGRLALALLLGVVATGAELVTPLVTREVLDGLAEDRSLRGPVLLLTLLLVVGTAIGYVQTVILGAMAERIILTARRSMIGRLLAARVTALAGRPPGEMVSRVTSDTTLIREATTSSVVYLVNGALGLVGALLLMAYLDVVLLGITLGVVVVGAAAAMALMPRLARTQREVQEQLGLLGGRLEGVLRAVRTVKAARAEHREAERVAEHAAEAARLGLRAVRIESAAWTLTGAAINLVVLVVLGVGAWRVSSGAIDVPTLVAFLLYVFQLMWPVMMLTMSITSLQSGLAAASRIHEITSLPVEDGDPATPPAALDRDAETPVLRLDDLVVRYTPGGTPALDGVSLSIPRRGHTAIVGPSGAGKTTLFSVLLKFVNAETGSVLLDGVPYDRLSPAAVRARFAYVEQDTPLVPGTVRENVLHAAPGASDDRLWAALREVRLDDRVRALDDGVETALSPTTLSGGERQRVAIARALAATPDVLLLDEATAQLDGLTESAVAIGVRRIAATGAVVSIAHRLSTVVDADQIVVLQDGRVRAVGTHHDLLDDELYAELVAAMRIGPVSQPAT